MSDTPNLQLPLIAAAQAQKHVTHNEALTMLDALVQLGVKGRTLINPPPTPAQGERWIVPAGATGAWAGQTNKIATWVNLAWKFLTPLPGFMAFVENEGLVVFVNNAWQSRMVVTGYGASTGTDILEEEVILAGASVSTTILIPSRSIVLAVSTRTTLAITGATSFNCGVSGDASKFGGALGIALGSTNVGVIGPTAYYADTPVLLTAVGSNFTGGRVRVAIHLLTFTAPTT